MVGTTNDYQRRLKEQNWNNMHYTGRIKGDWKLIYLKEFSSDKEARIEESRLKKAKNKKYIEWYIINKRVRSSTGRATPS